MGRICHTRCFDGNRMFYPGDTLEGVPADSTYPYNKYFYAEGVTPDQPVVENHPTEVDMAMDPATLAAVSSPAPKKLPVGAQKAKEAAKKKK